MNENELLTDIVNRLDRIEKALIQLTGGTQKPAGQDKPRPKDDRKKRSFQEFITKNIKNTSPNWNIKRVKVWDHYTAIVEKKNRTNQREFFKQLQAAFPDMDIRQSRIGSQFQYFCFGIDLK
jgi:hypothetical protein